MLRTNAKKARENVRAYIVNHFNACDSEYDESEITLENFPAVARYIWDDCKSAKSYALPRFLPNYIPQSVFEDWAQGLPSILDTCYYYNRSAVDDLGAILEETEEEKSKFSEQQAEKTLTALIYAEICKAVTRA